MHPPLLAVGFAPATRSLADRQGLSPCRLSPFDGSTWVEPLLPPMIFSFWQELSSSCRWQQPSLCPCPRCQKMGGGSGPYRLLSPPGALADRHPLSNVGLDQDHSRVHQALSISYLSCYLFVLHRLHDGARSHPAARDVRYYVQQRVQP
jgi:hypothetical protein